MSRPTPPSAAPPSVPASGEPAALAAWLRGLPPSVGPVRLVAVDGHAGSGKSTFATRLAAALGEAAEPGGGPAPVVRLDDLASHEALFAWTDRVRRQVLEPFAAGQPARHAVYDWVRGEFGPHRRELPPAPVVLVEGVGSGRRALRPYLACLLWMDLPEAVGWERGRLRDGPEQARFWDGWTRAERTHFAGDPSLPHAHLLVSQGHGGYGVRRGPAGLP
ncbi:hypothetical protein [Streptomyces sp. HNM0574]|uniref:uridine kinase family protein n=1 Tax=Streptomyces sp. HNM0574 TaxID=2714954 RepID=UPI00146BAFD0|nr:hypothetical protein [Streptomyces sp. HNM0574]NLU70701.1 hypothetical protein [Streptomyces sp. HNM0574]